MNTSSALKFVLLSVILLLGCTKKSFNEHLNIERKYALRDCMVKLELKWKGDVSLEDRNAVAGNMIKILNEVTLSKALPYFSWHTPNDKSYFVLYYVDKCEVRAAMTERLITDFLVRRIDDFPEHTIIAEDVEPGFDGVIPSGFWTDR